MGDRANYAIRENGEVALFYGQFGAGTLLADIFWGPEACEEMIRSQARDECWLDDVFGEAAVAMCKATRTLAFYDSRYRIDTQQLAARLMSQRWESWTVRAVRYVSGVAAMLDVELRDRERPLPSFVSDLGELAAVCRRSFAHAALIEVVRDGVRDRRVAGGELHRHLWHGPRLLEAVPFMTRLDDVRAGLASRFENGRPLTLLDGSGVRGIATIDVDRKMVDVTYVVTGSATHAYAFTGAAAERWPGWTVRRAIGTGAAHFARVGQPLPPDLEYVEPARPLIDQVRELAHGLFAGEPPEEKASAWQALLAPLELGDATAPHVVANDSIEGLALGMWAQSVHGAHRDGERILAVARTPKKPPVLLRWDDPRGQPRIVCQIGNEPRGGFAKTFTMAPSGRGCIVELASENVRELWWIDIVTRSAKRILEASPLATLKLDLEHAWEPTSDRDRIAFAVLDETALGGIGETVVVVYDGDAGYLGEQPGVAIARWSDTGLLVQRAAIAGGSYVAQISPFTSTADPRARMLDGPQLEVPRLVRAANALLPDEGAGNPAGAAEIALAALELDATNENALVLARAALVQLADFARLRDAARRQVAAAPAPTSWRVLAEACNRLRDHDEALRAAERLLAISPFDVDGHVQHAIALANTQRLDAAIAACERAIECDRERRRAIALDPAFEPLWGHAGWTEYEYIRLLETAKSIDDLERAEIRYREAIALAPARSDAYRALLALDVEDDTRVEISDRWRTACPAEVDAWSAHVTACIASGDLADARSSTSILLDRWPAHYAGHLAQARLMRLDGDEDGALVQLLEASETAQAQGEARAFFAALGDDEALSRLMSEAADEADPPNEDDDGVDVEID